jgi:hypothetical protein
MVFCLNVTTVRLEEKHSETYSVLDRGPVSVLNQNTKEQLPFKCGPAGISSGPAAYAFVLVLTKGDQTYRDSEIFSLYCKTCV